jgi:hydrogenase maturation protease
VGTVLVLGIGNILLQDEGVGVRAVERLQERYALPEGVEALDGGVRGMDLLSFFEGVSRLLVLDAVQTGQPPGTLVRLANDDIPSYVSPKISPHQEGLADVLWAARALNIYPEEVVLWGMEPASLGVGLELSAQVAAQVDALVERAVQELSRWDLEVQARPVESLSS